MTNEDKARRLGDSLERVTDPYVRMSLILQQAFGLRREESIKFQPSYADRWDWIVLKGSWTKGGHDGHACSNSIGVRRDRVESILLDPIRDDLLAPERIAGMAAEMQAYYRGRVRIMQTQAAEAPRELQERLRERVKRGDPDMTTDGLPAAIE